MIQRTFLAIWYGFLEVAEMVGYLFTAIAFVCMPFAPLLLAVNYENATWLGAYVPLALLMFYSLGRKNT